jgi:hypothetical protein
MIFGFKVQIVQAQDCDPTSLLAEAAKTSELGMRSV